MCSIFRQQLRMTALSPKHTTGRTGLLLKTNGLTVQIVYYCRYILVYYVQKASINAAGYHLNQYWTPKDSFSISKVNV